MTSVTSELTVVWVHEPLRTAMYVYVPVRPVSPNLGLLRRE